PDKELAAQLKRSVTAIQVRRALRGKAKPDPKYGPWTQEEDALLGSASDPQIAARIGRRAATVAARRKKLGIPHAPVTPNNAWSASEDALLGTAKDAEVAHRLERPIGGVRGRRKKRGIKSPGFNSTCRRW